MGRRSGDVFCVSGYRALRDGNALEGLAVSAVSSANVVTAKAADKAKMQLVSGNYFTLLGVQPVLGR